MCDRGLSKGVVMLVLICLMYILGPWLVYRVLDTDDGVPGRRRSTVRSTKIWHFAKHKVGTSAGDITAWLIAERETGVTFADWSRAKLWNEVTAWEHTRMASGGW